MSSPKQPSPEALSGFHPAVARWFAGRFGMPTDAQSAAWPAIRAGRHVLVAAPTGSGKTLTAFLAAIDALVRRGLARPDGLPDETAVLYVSPLKALSNDIRTNLDVPLAGIAAELQAMGLPAPVIRTAVRTGDTPAAERARTTRRPPHIVVTTPESFYVLLGSASGRRLLATVRTVIVDEIHALAPNKRGSHLALSLERLEALVRDPSGADPSGADPSGADPSGTAAARRVQRIGLSATQKPIDEVARFLVGAAQVRDGVADCTIVDIGQRQPRDLALEVPPTPLSAVMSNDQWEQVYGRVAELALMHRTTLVFVNTRRMAERAARHLAERLGPERVGAHHGSLSREIRLDAEQRLKRGALTLLVATASLELGLDIGDVDLVVQLGSPRSIAAFLQRAGRAGHAVGGTPKARLFPATRDELCECAALLDAVQRGELDALRVLPAPLDVLAQQVVAETACRPWDEDALLTLVQRAWPYAALPRERWQAVLRMLAEGYVTRQGPRGAWLHRDTVQHELRERRGARTTALTSGGTIPETGDYGVLLEPQAERIGSVNEDFAVESIAGDVFQLGNTSYRILKIEPGRVRVEDAQGAAPNIPFWLGEAPGRSTELSAAVSRLREAVEAALLDGGRARALDGLRTIRGVGDDAAGQVVDYLAATRQALGALPTQRRIVIERFFDASGGMQLVLHAPFGSRVNRAWGLALRKRFCRTFNFELQAAATEDAIVLSLSTAHSFDLPEVARYLHSATALDVLVQALLDAPLFNVRWRWNATTALALPRFVGGRKVAPQLQRMKSEDLLAAVFPDQVACAENLSGPRQVPDHPLVAQTLWDCLHDAMDAPRWLELLRGLEDGTVAVLARDLPAPSPLAVEALQARPYAFLDDAPLEERRTQAVQNRRYGELADVDGLGALDPAAIQAVRDEAWPDVRSADEMHETLVSIGFATAGETAANAGWAAWLAALEGQGRAFRLGLCDVPAPAWWIAPERLAQALAVHPGATLEPAPGAGSPPGADGAAEEPVDTALRELLRGRLAALGPLAIEALAAPFGLPPAALLGALNGLRSEGSVFEGRITPGRADGPMEWCERHLLARIHRYTLQKLRREIEPVEPRDFQRFLLDWQHVAPGSRLRGPEALPAVLAQLEGYEAPAAAWEAEILAARIEDYTPHWLDELCTSGRSAWARLRPVADGGSGAAPGRGLLRTTPLVLLPRRSVATWARLAVAKGEAAVRTSPLVPAPADGAGGAAGTAGEAVRLSGRAQRIVDALARDGASFFDEIVDGTRLLPAEAEDALAELVVRGRAHCDRFAGLRALMLPAAKRAALGRARRRLPMFGVADAGRWTLVRPAASRPDLPASPGASGPPGEGPDAATEHVARTLLRRYGVVMWRLMEREPAWLPPWRDLVRVYRRLEARGEIRGGRFVAGVPGEQFALPEAVASLRQVRRAEGDHAPVTLGAVDPANLVGSVVPGERAARVPGGKVVTRDGVPEPARAAAGPR